jgi:hypothetical protein
LALALAAACGELSPVESGPTHSFYRPIGIGVYGGALLVASSNADLRYDGDTGGSVITVDPAPAPVGGWVPWIGGLNIRSFAGELAVADPAVCPGITDALALVPVRGADLLYRVELGAGGAPTCDGCELSLRGHEFTDPFAVTVACGPGFARAYLGYLRSVGGRAWLTQIDLTQADPTADGAVQHVARGLGQLRAFAFDAQRKRLYAAQTATSATTVIRWYDLAGDCRIDVEELDGGCRGGVAALPPGLEPHGLALANGDPSRMYVAARIFDTRAAAVAGVRVGDMDGLLLVVNLVDDLAGQTHLQIEKQISIGYGVTALRVFPARTPPRRDAVAVLAAEDGVLWLYDDETDALVAIGRDARGEAATGHALVGAEPYGLAVDPIVRAGNVRVYVGSYAESFVTPIDVPLDDIDGWLQQGLPPPLPHILGGTP